MFPISDPILIFTLLALVMLIAPVFAERFRVPDLVLLLLFGALLGPHGLNVLARTSAIIMLGSVGLLYIMFLAGLEIDLFRFMQSYKRSLLFGFLTFIIPQSLGTLAGRFILGMNWPASILLASMFASHTLLAYPLASRMGLARTEPVAITVGATIITDTLALMVLAIIIAESDVDTTLGLRFWATIIVGMALLSIFIWKGIPWITRWFFQRVTEVSNAQFLYVLVLICGFGFLSHYAQMHPIIGAFLVGAALNRLIPEHSPLMSRVTFAGNTLFIPFFLISVGMLVDPRAMFTGTRSWFVGCTMVFMVTITKYTAAWISQKRFGYSFAARKVMFGLSVVQAAATLAAVVVGHELGIFDDAVLNGTIFMILVTCPLGSWFVDRYGRKMALETPQKSSSAESEQRILIPVANPHYATRLLDLAFLIRNSAYPGGIFPLAIARDQEDAHDAVTDAENLLSHCVAHATSADMAVSPSLRIAVNVSDSIVHSAKELRTRTVITGWSGKQSASVRVFGTVMHHLVVNCTARIMFCRLVGPLNTTKRIRILLPPLARRRRDIVPFLQDMKHIAHVAGAELILYSARGKDADYCFSLSKKLSPECRLFLYQKDTWKATRDSLLEDVEPEDILVLPVDRRNGITWAPELDRMPEMLATRFPDNNLIIVYPSLPTYDDESAASAHDMSDSDETTPDILSYDLSDKTSLDEACAFFAARTFPTSPPHALAAIEALTASAASYPVELAPGTILLHARAGHPPRPMIMICYAAKGWEHAALPTAAKVIIVLLGAEDSPPEEHLKTLSFIAKKIHEAAKTQAYISATSAEEIAQILRRPDTLKNTPLENSNASHES